MPCPPFEATRLCVLEFYRRIGQGVLGHLGFEVTVLDTFGPAFLAFWSLSAISRSNPLLPDSGWCEWYLKLRGFYFYNLSPLTPLGGSHQIPKHVGAPPEDYTTEIQHVCELQSTRQSIADILQAHCKQLASTLQAHCKQVHFDCKPQMAHCWRMCFSRFQASKYPFKHLYHNIKKVQYPSQGCF